MIETRADLRCLTCRGAGYSVDAVGEDARARLCTCVPACARCGGTGSIAADVPGGRGMRRCRCQALPDRVALFNRAGIPARFAHASLTSFRKDEEAKAEAFGWLMLKWMRTLDVAGTERGVVLWGKVGRGKTHLLVAILREIVFAQGIEVRFVDFPGLLTKLKEGFDKGKSDSALLGELARVPVLGIDELGRGRRAEWEYEVIDQVIARRYNAVGCTLATTNYRPGPPTGEAAPNLSMGIESKETLGDRVGERVWSRLCEMVDYREVGGTDWRTRTPANLTELVARGARGAGG